jgi:hypothetical protein
MARESCNEIVIVDGYWISIHHTRVYHRHYPEVRGEGRSLVEAATHLMNQLARSLDSAHGHGREAVERAMADVRALLRTVRPGRQQDMLAAVP